MNEPREGEDKKRKIRGPKSKISFPDKATMRNKRQPKGGKRKGNTKGGIVE